MFNRLITIFILVIIFIPGAFSQEDLLNFVIEQNESAREKIKTAEYKVKWTSYTELDEGRRHNKGFGQVKIKGQWRYSTYEIDASVPATGWEQKQTANMAINDKYLVYWPSIGNPYIYQNDHRSLEELSDDSKRRLTSHTTPDIYSFNFAFGGGKNTTFKEMMKLHPDEIKWTAEKANQTSGDIVYLIKQYAPLTNDRSKPYAIWTIDPQKGFLVTKAVFHSREGDVWITRTIEPKEFGIGIWVPVSYLENRYGDPDDSQISEEPSSSTNIQLEDIVVNKEISDNFFTLEAIFPEEHRESTVVFRTGLDGETEAFIYKYGRYIPRDERYNILQFAESLIGKILPPFDKMQINYSEEKLNEEPILICFFDIEQRPSRNCIIQLSKMANEIKEKGVTIITIQASKVEQAKLDEWIKEQNIPFKVVMIESDSEKTRFNWGVKSLPWLILTDKQHIVSNEGFSINELDKKIMTLREK